MKLDIIEIINFIDIMFVLISNGFGIYLISSNYFIWGIYDSLMFLKDFKGIQDLCFNDFKPVHWNVFQTNYALLI